MLDRLLKFGCGMLLGIIAGVLLSLIVIFFYSIFVTAFGGVVTSEWWRRASCITILISMVIGGILMQFHK